MTAQLLNRNKPTTGGNRPAPGNNNADGSQFDKAPSSASAIIDKSSHSERKD